VHFYFLLLTFFPSFIQQTFIHQCRVDYGLGTELGAEAVFLSGHALVLSGEEPSSHHYNTVLWGVLK